MKSFACMWLGSSVVCTLSDTGHWSAPAELANSLDRQFGNVVLVDGVGQPNPLTLDARFAAACERMGGVELKPEPKEEAEDTAIHKAGE